MPAIVLNVFDKFVPTRVRAETMATEIRAEMSPYSTAVTPLSSIRPNRLARFLIVDSGI